MEVLSCREIEEVSGSGLLVFILPVVVGFIVGGPVGAGYALGGVVLTAGAKNLEHLQEHGKPPTFNEILNY